MMAAMPRIIAVYLVRCDAASIDSRAAAIAVEQSVEMPISAIDDSRVLADIVGRVESIDDCGGSVFEVRIALATATTGLEPGQLMNMLFGNTSIHADLAPQLIEVTRKARYVSGAPTCLRVGLGDGAGDGADPLGEGAVGLVREAVVVLDEVNTAAGESHREIRERLRRHSLRLQGRTGHSAPLGSRSPPQALKAMVRAAKRRQNLRREDDVLKRHVIVN